MRALCGDVTKVDQRIFLLVVGNLFQEIADKRGWIELMHETKRIGDIL